MMHAMSLSEKVNRVGGAYLLEQPADRGRAPFASVWATPQMQAMEERCGASRTYVEQCAFGGPTPKPTTFSSTLPGMPATGPLCPPLCSGQSRSRACRWSGRVNCATVTRTARHPGRDCVPCSSTWRPICAPETER